MMRLKFFCFFIFKNIVLIFFFCIINSSLLLCQTLDSPTLEQCIKLAIKNSPSIKNRSELFNAANVSYKIDKAVIKPQFDVYLNSERSKFNQYSYNYLNSGIDFYIDLPKILGKYPRFSEIEIDKYRLFTEMEKKIITFGVKKKYYTISKLELNLKSIYEGLGYLEHHLAVVQALYESGQKSKLDFLNTQSEILKLREDELKIKKEIDKLKNHLNILIGRSPEEQIIIKSSVLKTLPDIAPIEKLTNIAFDNNPKLLVAKNEKKRFIRTN